MDLRNHKKSPQPTNSTWPERSGQTSSRNEARPLLHQRKLSNSNTDGTHGKQCPDRNKLNSIKVLVFRKFLVESAAEKEVEIR